MFAGYVDAYSDLAAAYETTGVPNFAQYVKSYSDLENFWQENIKPLGISRVEWGEDHWSAHGSGEGRTAPKTYPQTKEQWGKDHWKNHGVSEGRVIPGALPSMNIDQQGNLSWNFPTEGSLSLVSEPVQRLLNNIKSNVIDNASGGNFPGILNEIEKRINTNMGNVTSSLLKSSFLGNVIPQVSAYYQAKVIGNPWDAKALGVQPPVGGFVADYYAKTKGGQQATQQWNAALNGASFNGVNLPNIDITGRYTYETYLHKHYGDIGKSAGYRGNEAYDPEEVTGFKETLTDYEKQLYRDQILGITTDPDTGEQKLVLDRPEYDEEGNLINTEDVNTTLEKQLSSIISAKDVQKEKQLGALAQDLLKVSIEELKKAKQKESNLQMLMGLPGYSEIMEINTTLKNSILGDTGIGGILSLTGGKKEFEKRIESSLEKLTGVSSNSAAYNWQKWFDEDLKKRYEEYEIESREYSEEELNQLQASAKEEINLYKKAVEEGDTTLEKPIYEDIAERYEETEGKKLDVNNAEDFKKIMFHIDMEAKQEFMSDFINDYIKPRFDQSKSMDEFISYLDVNEEEQNVFQSQTTLNKIQQIAGLRSRSFLDLIQLAENTQKNFDSEFYRDPLSKNTKQLSERKLKQYTLQKDIFDTDFANAQAGRLDENGIDWAIEAYRYGFEGDYATNPDTFAKLHYQVKGSTGAVKDEEGNSFILDPAEDILPYEELDQKIKNFGTELAARREFYGGAGFMTFVTPEEFADAVLASVSPEENKEEWDKLLASIGLEGVDATVEKVKEYLIEQLRTEEAKNIRESIKYLNEVQEDVNQKNLGVSYIERPEDVKEVKEGQTVLYNIFKQSGFNGTEDDFYNEFFPDIDRTEQEVITKSMSERGLEANFGDFEDPFTAFSNLSGLFGEDETAGSAAFERDEDEEQQTRNTKSSYFRLFEDDEEELPEKSEAASSFLKDFTSMFQGFK